MKVSKRISEIPMSGIRKMFDLAGPGSINLGLGEPDLDPPREAIEGMNAAALKGLNKYGPTAGIPELREAVAERFSRYGEISASNVMITPSGSSALLEISQTFVDPGDEVQSQGSRARACNRCASCTPPCSCPSHPAHQ
ncbi:MAG: aminotransferase class I/II-fold pyridoxal phosphate-dependent enzyme [Candidatus Methanomethylophilaceae archaeon]|nr:aminotransferase class I/II-fold pyridoxal phosphate-dependent enzyme [Candidatus Methanomethylophilaceae archaeon]